MAALFAKYILIALFVFSGRIRNVTEIENELENSDLDLDSDTDAQIDVPYSSASSDGENESSDSTEQESLVAVPAGLFRKFSYKNKILRVYKNMNTMTN